MKRRDLVHLTIDFDFGDCGVFADQIWNTLERWHMS